MSEEATRIIGVDFSGAVKEGKTWIAEGTLQEVSLKLQEPRPILRRDLTEFLKKEDSNTIVAMDFPFSVPSSFVGYWHKSGKKLSKPSNMHDLWKAAGKLEMSNKELKEWCKEFVADMGEEPKRVGDKLCPDSFSPFHSVNPDMIPMTFHGMKMLDALWRNNNCRVPPLNCSDRSGPVLLEVFPGDVLNSFNLPYKNYKNGLLAFNKRRKILSRLPYITPIKLPNFYAFREHCMFSDDCLDAIVAAVAAAIWEKCPDLFNSPPDVGDMNYVKVQREGWLYSLCAEKLKEKDLV